jgi:hypothetical protein
MLNALKRHQGAYNFLRIGLYGRLRSAMRHKVFQDIYRGNGWDDPESVSGPGSNVSSTAHIRTALPELIRELNIKSLLDVPCGDYYWMKDVSLGIPYIGGDLLPDLVASNRKAYPETDFRVIDLLRDTLPQADAVFCRDCLVHLSLRDIDRAIASIKKSKARYLIVTTFPHVTENADTVAPYWRPLNMALYLGEPDRLIRDYADEQTDHTGKYLGVWRL